ncbi:MAG: ATP-binding cassette domain-containing protein [Spirochaetes bacterium]|nr:ATP-binding cassette domain-containing protein [Spirochaetota bacterium]
MLLQADSIRFAYRDTPVLSGLYCNLRAGETLALLGRNGSGKSTFFKFLLGFLPNHQGVVKIQGSYVAPGKRLRWFSWLAQDPFLPTSLSVRGLFRLLDGRKPKQQPGVSTAADQHLAKHKRQQDNNETVVLNPYERPEIQAVWNKRIGSLSVGERRFVELAVILNQSQPILLLDEPFTGLQPSSIDAVLAAIGRKAALGHGIILSDHQYRPVLESSSRCALLVNGRLHETPAGADPAELLKSLYLPGTRAPVTPTDQP